MDTLKITSAQAMNTIPISRALAAVISERLHVPTAFVEKISWQARYRGLDAGEIDIGWICGWPYVRYADRPDPTIELLVAPVMQGERYQNRPIYFSDVIVHRDSLFEIFADLRGASWVYNEPESHSGYNITCFTLAQMGETAAFFGKVVGSGAHRKSLQMILDRQIDASAIDSTVLEWVLEKRPSLHSQIRIIDTLGPSPIPPLVILKTAPPDLTEQIRHLLLHLHETEDGRDILAMGHLARFTAVTDQDYDAIRHMARRAAQVALVVR